MSVLPIVPLADPALRRPCDPVGAVDDDLRILAADMLETLRARALPALAAPQVGVKLRLLAMLCGGVPRICLNPQILSRSQAQVISVEASLSGDGAELYVARPDWVVLRWDELEGGEATELLTGAEAVAAQRKLDLLDGRSNADLPDCAPLPRRDRA